MRHRTISGGREAREELPDPACQCKENRRKGITYGRNSFEEKTSQHIHKEMISPSLKQMRQRYSVQRIRRAGHPTDEPHGQAP